MEESEANVIQVKIGDYFIRLDLPRDEAEAWMYLEPDPWIETGARFRRAAQRRQQLETC